ncbi:MAG: ABC transporter permease [Gemmatimonadales bacterium]
MAERAPAAPNAARRPWRERALAQLTLARFREFYREPEALFWTFVFPLIMAGGLGLAFRSKPPEVVKVAVVQGHAPNASAIARGLEQETALDVRLVDDTVGARELRTGRIALLVVPRVADQVEFRYDETRREGASARWIVNDALQRAFGRADPVAVSDSLVTDRGARYIDFLVPGLIGMNLMATGIWGVGFTVVDQRRKKLLKRFVVTPMSRVDYLLSFMLSRLGWLVLEVIVLVGGASLVFGVPTRGSLALLGLTCLLGALTFGGMGLLLAARTKTIEGASGLMNLVMMPMWVFSGVFFASGNFPDAMQPFIQSLPLTAVNDALRANMLEGATALQLLPEMGVIALWLVGCFALALKLFHWR